ncbi:MAG: hypothetical protein VB058_02025 [Oscillospiraceae bacterium]|nr:hypothetical protein [Oscillospiraceae bacterium]
MTELSKFLTFLSDDERQQVLMKFGEIFDAAPNQDELLGALVSPLKVTVELSRAYSRGGLQQALDRSVELSGVDLSAAPPPPSPAAESVGADIYAAIGSAVEEAFESAAEPAAEPAAPISAEPVPVEPAEPVPAESVPVEPAEHVPAESVPVEPAEPVPAEPVPVETAAPVPAEPVPVEPAALSPAEPAVPEFEDTEPEEFFDEAADEAVPQGEYRAKPAALIFFILLFVPLGLAGIAVLLCVGAALIAVAAAAIGSGVFAVSLAFSGMTVFADIIMTIGVALVCFAAGVLFLWLALWFLIRCVGGLVRGILHLGKKWCYKEVSAG